MPTPRAWAEIDLEAFHHNLGVLRASVGPGVAVAAVVKADAYGHGAVRLGGEALAAGCAMLAVGDLSEALELRESGLQGPVLMLGALLPGDEIEAVRLGVRATLHAESDLLRMEAAARKLDRPAVVHVKVDSGMHRLGAAPEEAGALARRAVATGGLVLEGLYTHLSSAGAADDAFTGGQLAAFRGVVDALERDGIRPPLVHAANSAAAFRFPVSRFGMVRSGIALYGIDPGIFARLGVSLQPILSWRACVAAVRTIGTGETVGYDQRFRAVRPTRVAVVPVGYHDGYSYRLGNRGTVLVGGRRAPVIGSVTMDYLMLDVTDLPPVEVGQTATLIGHDGSETLRVEELAGIVGTIPYELTCRLGPRVKRVYVGRRPAVGGAAA